MKKMWTAIVAALLLAVVFGAGAAYAHDAEYGMWNGEQNGLLLGTVEEAGEDWVVLKDVKALPSGDKGGFLDRQLPPEEVPERLKVTGLRPYAISYSGAAKPEAGHHMLVSADLEEDGDWKALWSPYEVSSLDPSTLEFLPEREKTMAGFAWEWFVHSGGTEHDFLFDYGDDVETLCIRRTQADGSVKDEIIFQREKGTESQAAGGNAAPEGTGNQNGSGNAAPESAGGQAAGRAESSQNAERAGASGQAAESAAGTTAAIQTGAAANTNAAANANSDADANAAASPSAQSQPTNGDAMGLEAILIAVAAGFFGGMVITRLKKRKR